jgi:hypothetical protein
VQSVPLHFFLYFLACTERILESNTTKENVFSCRKVQAAGLNQRGDRAALDILTEFFDVRVHCHCNMCGEDEHRTFNDVKVSSCTRNSVSTWSGSFDSTCTIRDSSPVRVDGSDSHAQLCSSRCFIFGSFSRAAVNASAHKTTL